jgi:SAM-dependent methyltransferase
MSSSYRMELDKWLANLDVKADRLLDIGGSQLPLPGRVKSFDVKEYLIADLPEPHVDSPKPDVELDMNKRFTNLIEFDMIFCLEVFEYIYDPMAAFKNIYHLLVDGGEAWVTFPSQYPLHQPIEDDALRYMPAGIKKLAYAVDLKIEEMIPRRTETDAIHNAFRIERMRSAKGEDHNISGWIVRLSK